MEEIQAGLRGVLRLFIFALVIVTYLTWSFMCHVFIRDPQKRRAQFSKNTNFFCRVILKAFNMSLTVINKPANHEKFLLVSNHMGFIDILLMSSIFPLVFVTSHEMRETPFLGLLTEMGGCMYVERRSRTKILDEMKSLAGALQSGFRVVLYPESTSHNGECVLPFKRTLMMAAAHGGVPIQTAVVNFREVNGEEFSLKWRDHLCWYGDIPFATSLWRSLTLKSLRAEIEFLEAIEVSLEDDRAAIADRAHAIISARFSPVKSPSPLQEAPAGMEPT